MAITLADFNKIWASTSPLTPYSFSESNYKQGWNFIGSTPPARQMWDFLQKNNDEKMQYLADNFLPLSGGTMTGAIVGNPLTLSADDGNDSADLVLNSSGSATWNGKEVERVNANGNGAYIRYESGLQIVLGSVNDVTSSGTTVTYSMPFAYSVRVIPLNSSSTLVYCSSFNNTQATFNLAGSGSLGVNFVVIGWWK